MMGKGDLAVRAGEGVTTFRAEEKGMEPPPVEKKECLPSARQGFSHRLDEGVREEWRQSLLVPLHPQIDYFDTGKGRSSIRVGRVK